MPDEENTNPSVWMRAMQRVRNALSRLLDPAISVSLVVVSIVEALVAPFFGIKWALCALATAAAAGALILAWGSLWIQYIGTMYENEVKNLADPQGRAAPEKPPSWWKN